MNLFRLTSCFGATLLLASCSISKHTVTKREPFAATPVSIDGNDNDWPSPYPYYDSKAMISYAVSNDRDRLYLSVKASDARMRAKILRGGMSIWIDTLGGTSQHLLIHSPMPDAIPRGEGAQARRRTTEEEAGDPAQQRDAAARRKEMMLGAEQYSLTGFGACDGSFAGTTGAGNTNTCGVQVRLGINEYNELVWEAAIPFTAWHHHALTQRDAGKALSICFEVGGVKMPARTTGGDMNGGGMGHMGGGGGRMGGGMGRGGGGGGGRMGGGMRNGQGSNDDAATMSQTTKTWLKTALAYQ